MIDEKKLKEEIKSLAVIITGLRAEKGVLNKYMKHYRESVLRIIDEQPKIDWIPCEVEMPPMPRFSEDSYLVKTQCVTTPYTAYWNGKKWTNVLDDDIEDVIAWCQIPRYPQPYKKEGAENE